MAYTELQEYLTRMQAFLKDQYSDCILMPTRNNVYDDNNDKTSGKNPLYVHKAKTREELWELWDTKGSKIVEKGLSIILRKGMIVMDVDDCDVAKDLEEAYPEIKATSIQKTRTGYHYFFRRTPVCDAAKIWDKARCLGTDYPVDIKTICSTGTGGIISIWPSPNKEWIRSLYEYPPIDLPDELFTFIKSRYCGKKTGLTRTLPVRVSPVSVNLAY